MGAGVANTVRPNVTGGIQMLGSVDRWFDTAAFIPVMGFGNLGRNVVIGPGFNNFDFSTMKNMGIGEKTRVQFRAEFFNLFNTANLSNPNASLASGAQMGRITSADAGRVIQFALKFLF